MAISAKRSPAWSPRQPALRERHPRLVLELGAVEGVQLADVCEVEHAAERIDLHRGRRRAIPAGRASISREIELDTSRRTTAPKRRLRTSVSTASSRSSASSEISVSPSRVSRNDARSTTSISGKSRDRKWPITSSSGMSEPALADRDEPVEALRHLHPREPLLARLRVANEDAEAERQPGDVGERLAGPDRERRQDREDVAQERPLELLPARPRRARRPCRPASPRVRVPGRARCARYVVCSAVRRQRRRPDLGQRLLRRAAVARANAEARVRPGP